MAFPQAKLELRELGNTGHKVGSTGFGASPLGSIFGPVSEHEAIASVREAYRLDTMEAVSETIPAFQKLKDAGKIRFIGITELLLQVFTYVLDRVPPGAVDVILSYRHYNINDSTFADLLPYLKSKGVGVISASPLAMGLLTESGPPDWHPASPELKSACLAAADYCKKKGKNITKLAMQYSLSNKDISMVLVRMCLIKQVEENVAAAVELATFGRDKEILSEVEAILEPVKNQT